MGTKGKNVGYTNFFQKREFIIIGSGARILRCNNLRSPCTLALVPMYPSSGTYVSQVRNLCSLGPEPMYPSSGTYVSQVRNLCSLGPEPMQPRSRTYVSQLRNLCSLGPEPMCCQSGIFVLQIFFISSQSIFITQNRVTVTQLGF